MSRAAMVIPASPRLHVGDLVGRPVDAGLFKAFYGEAASLFYFGRGALWQAMQSLGLSAADNVLVPSYHCGVEIEAVAMSGVQLYYYPIAFDTGIAPSTLEELIDGNTKAVLVIHYFGFPQPIDAIRELCNRKKLALIEDCCHALFSCHQGRPLGTLGDFSVFSQRKTLPLADGGALLARSRAASPQQPTDRPSSYVALKKTLGMLLRTTLNTAPGKTLPFPLELAATLVNRGIARTAGTRYGTGLVIDRDRCSLGMSSLSERVMNRTDIDGVIRRRRDNYRRLGKQLRQQSSIKMLHEELDDGVCPLFLPVRVKETSRPTIQERLSRLHIGTFVFGEELHPSLPRDRFPEAEALSAELLCLPVHQELNAKQMDYLAKQMLTIVRELDHAHTR